MQTTVAPWSFFVSLSSPTGIDKDGCGRATQVLRCTDIGPTLSVRQGTKSIWEKCWRTLEKRSPGGRLGWRAALGDRSVASQGKPLGNPGGSVKQEKTRARSEH